MWLLAELPQLQAAGSPAFREVSQAAAVVDLAFGDVIAAYRDHHVDLLGHQPDSILFSPFFLARVCEAVLAQGAPWARRTDTPRKTTGKVT